MSTIFYRSETGQERSSPRRRAVSFALAVAIEVLLILALLTLDFRDRPKPQFKGGTIATFDISNEKESESAPAKSAKPVAAIREVKHPILPPLKPTITQPQTQIIPLSKEDLEASDIAHLGSSAPGAGQVAEGHAPGDSERVGTGPHGEPLYAAEWYREPTDTEVNAYLPKTLPDGGGWGLIACRTIERFRVTDCVELGQSPAGSHLAGAARQAAWQFLVRPPRVGGKPLVGEWVRIRIDWTFTKSGGAAN